VGAVLLVAYAFPPIQVQMSPVVARLAAGLHALGFAVDVITADPAAASAPLPRDDGLVDYVAAHCRRIQRVGTAPAWWRRLLRRPLRYIAALRDFPDAMGGLHRAMFAAVMAAGPEHYRAVISVSPFHTVNPVMVRVKRHRPGTCWIGWFCDPWSGNPLEPRRLVRAWSAWREPQTLRAADYVAHSSVQALERVQHAYPFLPSARTRVVSHCFDRALYPSRPKARNERLTLRFIGTLFGRRSPTPLLLALDRLIAQRPELAESVWVELIGPMDRPLAAWEGFSALPAGLVSHRPAVGYRASLDLMYDADLLLVIEADVAATPFVPSKLMDYMGAETPIIGIAPAGGCRDVLERLGCPCPGPADHAGIAAALESGIARIRVGGTDWYREEVRRTYDLTAGTAAFLPLILDESAP
jgi:hypothetical protein